MRRTNGSGLDHLLDGLHVSHKEKKIWMRPKRNGNKGRFVVQFSLKYGRIFTWKCSWANPNPNTCFFIELLKPFHFEFWQVHTRRTSPVSCDKFSGSLTDRCFPSITLSSGVQRAELESGILTSEHSVDFWMTLYLPSKLQNPLNSICLFPSHCNNRSDNTSNDQMFLLLWPNSDTLATVQICYVHLHAPIVLLRVTFMKNKHRNFSNSPIICWRA